MFDNYFPREYLISRPDCILIMRKYIINLVLRLVFHGAIRRSISGLILSPARSQGKYT